MTEQKLLEIYRPAALASIEDVITLLSRLGHELDGSDLAGLKMFNTAYLLVTKTIAEARDEFTDFGAMQRLDIGFVGYYIEALAEYLRDGHTVPAWQEAFEASHGGRSRMLTLALGVNAHINNDLGQSLRDVGGVASEDYKPVNRLIASISGQIIKDTGIGLGPLSGVEAVIMARLIKSWRRYDWRVYEGLMAGALDRDQIEREGKIRAIKLKKLPWPR